MSESQVTILPVFPLQTVLFPGGVLPLRIFEARYMDMTTRCLRENDVFGVNLIAEGHEVGTPAVPHAVGVSARIIDWDMAQVGVLQVVTRGERRFRILNSETAPDGLLMAEVAWLEEPPLVALPEGYEGLVTLLKAIVDDVDTLHFPEPHHFDEAGWVGMRLASVLPIPMAARQGLLELDDPLVRLDILRHWLEQQGLGER